ncbi:hypothetical protein CU100_25710 [Phyllobacterium endophyticum]|uniref:Uncharacterized protein n=1 Tax=Phyllobacterium endophyticum TaxID=1149773 RepID=A0A2P7AK57_9HYPH|nr:hypothetical protein CU100_25710 [Phyllobacterium endophyticum]
MFRRGTLQPVVDLLLRIALGLHKGRAVAFLAGTRANDIKQEKIAVTLSAPKKLREQPGRQRAPACHSLTLCSITIERLPAVIALNGYGPSAPALLLLVA